jgi:hypothetical protein
VRRHFSDRRPARFPNHPDRGFEPSIVVAAHRDPDDRRLDAQSRKPRSIQDLRCSNPNPKPIRGQPGKASEALVRVPTGMETKVDDPES